MQIERLQIEGGFLDGFDVPFAKGLNVLIGARGTGKTSVIELLRFALDAKNHTAEAGQRSLEHAKAVLGDGVVTVLLGDAFGDVSVTRSAGDSSPKASGDYERPLIFSQTEIENLGLSESGRLRLLDDFIVQGAALTSREAAAVSAIRSVFKEIASVEQEKASLAFGLEGLDGLSERIRILEAQEALHRAASGELAEKQMLLDFANAQIALAAVQEGVLGRFTDTANDWAEKLEEFVGGDFGPEEWSDNPDADPLKDFRGRYSRLVGQANALSGSFKELAGEAASAQSAVASARLEADNRSRALRVEVEQSVAGAGTVSRQLSQLRTEAAQLLAKRKIVDDRDQRIQALRLRRDERIKALDAVRAERFDRRSALAAALTRELAPQIRVNVERYGQYGDYGRALTDALRGSGMRYNDLVTALTQSVSPHELIQFLDSEDFIGLAGISGIPKDRAARLLGHLREVGAADIATVSIEDNVRMSLLDGVDYKDIENLSAGQRCTVVLSVILQHSTRTLIIDQPEDHLDNAYIATTIIKAICGRKSDSQMIISTHNANIPVLGGAELVIEMTSDGRNGFVQVCEELSNPRAVDAITNVMEGGREAFADRAEFYSEHDRL